VPVSTTNGNVKSGNAPSATLPRTDTAVNADAAAATGIPESATMRAWNAVPVAPPSGVMRLKALPARCVVITTNQLAVRSASRCNSQTHTKLASSAPAMAGIQTGSTFPRLSHASNTSASFGNSK